MIKFDDKELKHIKQMLEETVNCEEFKGDENIPSMQIVLDEFDTINEVEIINQLLIDVLEIFYAWYWLRCVRYGINNLNDMCEEMEREEFFNDMDVKLFRKINS